MGRFPELHVQQTSKTGLGWTLLEKTFVIFLFAEYWTLNCSGRLSLDALRCQNVWDGGKRAPQTGAGLEATSTST